LELSKCQGCEFWGRIKLTSVNHGEKLYYPNKFTFEHRFRWQRGSFKKDTGIPNKGNGRRPCGQVTRAARYVIKNKREKRDENGI
jgi:hypothetical protein